MGRAASILLGIVDLRLVIDAVRCAPRPSTPLRALLLATLLLATACGFSGEQGAVESPPSQHKVRAAREVKDPILATFDLMQAEGVHYAKVAPRPDEIQSCLNRLAARSGCSLPARVSRELPLRVALDPAYRQRWPRWRERVDASLACVNSLFAPSGLRWRPSVTSWEPGPYRGQLEPLLQTLQQQLPADQRGVSVGIVTPPARDVYTHYKRHAMLKVGRGTGVVLGWPSSATDCISVAQVLALQVGAKRIDGRRWVLGRRWLHGLPTDNPTARVTALYRFHPRNVEAMRVFSRARMTQQGLNLPPLCRRRIQQIDQCYFRTDPQAFAIRARCQQGKLASCVSLGLLFERAIGVQRDDARAAKLYGRACDGGYLPGCVRLGHLALYGRGQPRHPGRAVKLYARACLGKYWAACAMLGVLVRQGHGTSRDEERARKLFAGACSQRVMLGCVHLGHVHWARATPADRSRAAALYGQACDGGYMYGCYNLAGLYLHGHGVARDRARAEALLQIACDGGYRRACSAFGVSRFLSDPRAAVKRFTEACRQGDWRGCHYLGLAKLSGRGVAGDPAGGLRLLRRGCDAGHARSCVALAKAYYLGKLVQRDHRRAARLAARACRLGDTDGCHALALLYSRGHGLARQPARAAALWHKVAAIYRTGCDRGGLRSCHALAHYHLEGHGVPRDPRIAAALLRRACEGGYLWSCETLGRLYLRGRGVPRAPARGRALLRRACKGGVRSACSRRR